MKIVRLLSDWMLVRVKPGPELTRGGIVDIRAEVVSEGLVLMAGPGRRYVNKFVPMEPGIVGERVAFLTAVADTKQGLEHQAMLGKELRLIRQGDVLFVIEGDTVVELGR